MKNKIKKIALFLVVLLGVLIILNFELLSYAFMQAKGQLKIVWNTQKVEEVITQKSLPDSLIQKLKIVQKAKKFAIDSLGLNPSESYNSIYDQKGEPVLWVVTACQPYELSACEWDFPILGKFSYKGFFEKEKAEKEFQLLENQGFDVNISTVNAWSTLGWLPDPILSNTLFRPEAELSELIIHELTHGTLYIKDSVEFNENLATFVGVQGALRFINAEYGKNSHIHKQYLQGRHDDSLFTVFALNSAEKLDNFYKTLKNVPENKKKLAKQNFIQKLCQNIDTLQFYDESYKKAFSKKLPNNTFFMNYRRYNAQQNFFETEFREKFNSNFPQYFKYLKSRYKSL